MADQLNDRLLGLDRNYTASAGLVSEVFQQDLPDQLGQLMVLGNKERRDIQRRKEVHGVKHLGLKSHQPEGVFHYTDLLRIGHGFKVHITLGHKLLIGNGSGLP
ncbi:hypothetical protein FQZ97_955560 [compost metagenome]